MQVLTKAQIELLNAARGLVHYLEMIAAGVITDAVDSQAKCINATEDAIRLVKLQGTQAAQLADALGEPSDEVQRIARISMDLDSCEVTS